VKVRAAGRQAPYPRLQSSLRVYLTGDVING
jgi:hypothetical protein